MFLSAAPRLSPPLMLRSAATPQASLSSPPFRSLYRGCLVTSSLGRYFHERFHAARLFAQDSWVAARQRVRSPRGISTLGVNTYTLHGRGMQAGIRVRLPQ